MPNFKKDESKFQMKNTAYWKNKFAESEKASPYNKSSFTTNGDPRIMIDDSGNVIPSTRYNAPRRQHSQRPKEIKEVDDLPTFEKGDVGISQYDKHGNKLYNIKE